MRRFAIPLSVVVVLAQPVRAAEAQGNHLNVAGRQMLTLEAIGANGPCSTNGLMPLEFTRNLPNGSPAPFPDTPIPPRGKLLVVTDVDWQVASGTPNTTQLLRLFVVNKATGFSFRALESTLLLDSAGAGGTTTSVTSGFAMAAGAALCLDTLSISGSSSGTLQHVVLRGYYTPDR